MKRKGFREFDWNDPEVGLAISFSVGTFISLLIIFIEGKLGSDFIIVSIVLAIISIVLWSIPLYRYLFK